MSRLRLIGTRVNTAVFSVLLAFQLLAADTESVEASAEQWFHAVFARGFIEGDPNFMDYYQEPIYLVIGEAARALSKEEFAAAIDEHYVQPWLAAGWETTSVVDAQVESLGSDSARVTASWALLDGDGNNVMGCNRPHWHYILARKENEWRVIADIEGDCSE